MPRKCSDSFSSSEDRSARAAEPVWFWASLVVLSVIRLWLVGVQSLTAYCDATYDERLFLNIAVHLLNGQWLGPYDQLTLAKGMFYPLWIAAVHALGIPLLLSQHLLYVTACFVTVIAVRPMLHSRVCSLMFFSVLMFNPMSYSAGVMPTVLREGVYSAQTLLIIGFAAGFLIRHKQSHFKLIPWSIGLGLILSSFWLTREEGIWTMPFTLLVTGATAFRMWQTGPLCLRRLSLCVLPYAICLISLGVVAGMNKVHYGVLTTAEVKSKDFVSAYGALNRVKHIIWEPTVPMPRETRERIYMASPSFAELKPFLEADVEKKWVVFLRDFSERYGKDPEFREAVRGLLRLHLGSGSKDTWVQMWYSGTLFSREVPGGLFIWLLRDAVAAAGHHASGRSASDYYRRLAAEINTACADGRLLCGPERSTLMPPWHNAYAVPMIRAFLSGAAFLASFEGFSARTGPSEGSDESVALFRKVTRERLFPAQIQIKGWAFSPETEISLSVGTDNGAGRNAVISVGQKSADVYEYFSSKGANYPNASQSRFELATYCTRDCFLYIKSGDRLIKRLPLDHNSMHLNTPELQLHIDSFEYKDASRYKATFDAFRLQILELFGKAYQLISPVLCVIGLMLYLAGTLRMLRKRTVTISWIITTGLLLAIGTRLFLMSFIHVSSFPGIGTRYLAPVYPLLLMFVALNIKPGYYQKKDQMA